MFTCGKTEASGLDPEAVHVGVVDGIEVTAGDIILITAIGAGIAVAMLVYAYTVRYEPTKRAYLVLGLLSVATLVIGVLFTAAIALLGAAIGYWETRRTPVE
ncbi:MAG: hypothetical protein V5A34_04485 [Halapricum sp.]